MNAYDEALFARMANVFTPVKRDVLGWGEIYLRPLTGDETDRLGKSILETDSGQVLTYKGLAAALCRPDGSRFMDPANPEDVARLAAQPWKVIKQAAEFAEAMWDSEEATKKDSQVDKSS